MTKAEAFEYFKGKRVACDNFNCVAIQHKFFDVGIKWRGGSTKATDERGSFIFVDLNGYLTHCNSRVWFDTHEYEVLSADDILSIEIIEDKKNEFVDCSEPCPEIKAVQELLRNSKHLKDKIIVITKDNAAIL